MIKMRLGINGALMQRQSPPPEPKQAMNGYACTMGVEDYDSTEDKIFIMAARWPCQNMHCLEWRGKDIIRIQKEIYLEFINLMRMRNRILLNLLKR